MSINALISLVGGAYSDLMLDAYYGGFPFNVLNTETEDGRRIQRLLFPGQDRVAYQDLGQADGNILVTGLLIGDDFVHQAERLRSIFQAPGPKTLDVPFFDSAFQVVPVGLPKITFDIGELRVARLSFTVSRLLPRQAPAVDTLQGILDAISDLQTQARLWMRQVLSPLGVPLAIIGAVQNLAQQATGIWDEVTGGGGDAQISAAVVAPVAALETVAGLPRDSTYADAVVDALAAPSAAIVAAAMPVTPAVVGPGGDATTPVAADARIAATTILSAAASLAPSSMSLAGAPVALTAQCLALADAVNASSDIAYTSQQDALAWQAQLSAAIDVAATSAAQAAASNPIFAGPVWRSLVALKAALAADLNQVIGRLPAVQILTVPRPTSVWLIAQHLAGDQPDTMLATYLDIVQRNAIAQPGLVLNGPLEVLS